MQDAVDLGTFTKGCAIFLASEIPTEHWEGAYANIGNAATEVKAIAKMRAYVTEKNSPTEEETDLQKEHPKAWKNSNKAYKSLVNAAKKVLNDSEMPLIVDGNRKRLPDFKEDVKILRRTVEALQNAIVTFEAQDNTKQ